jgi:hypothetical protein
MANVQPLRFKTIGEFHQFRGLPKPEHPLISVINLESVRQLSANETSIVKDFFSIALKRNFNARMKYGQQNLILMKGLCSSCRPVRFCELKWIRILQ